MKEKTNGNARTALRTCIPMLLICALLLTGATYAWFSGYWASKPGTLSFGTSGIEYPTMTAWTYLTHDEGSTSSLGEWVAETCEGNGEKKLTPAGETPAGTAAYLATLHFGTIDNLLSVKEDNTLYFCFAVDRARFGDTVTLSVAPYDVNGFPFELYDGRTNGSFPKIADSGDSTPNAALKAIIEGDASAEPAVPESPLLDIYYCVCGGDGSGNMLAPGTAAFAELEFTEAADGTAEIVNGNATGDFYYVYVKMTPKLSTFVSISKQLISYMPCIIVYNAKIDLSFRNYVTGN